MTPYLHIRWGEWSSWPSSGISTRVVQMRCVDWTLWVGRYGNPLPGIPTTTADRRRGLP